MAWDTEKRIQYRKMYYIKNKHKALAEAHKYKLLFPEKYALSIKKCKLKKYGLTIETHAELLRAQQNVCAICFLPEPNTGWDLTIDHDHKTGRVRGLLCHKCNKGLGLLGDTLERIESAYNYFKGH